MAVIPIFFNGVFGANVSFGGTSLIIIVGVILEACASAPAKQLTDYKWKLHQAGSENNRNHSGSIDFQRNMCAECDYGNRCSDSRFCISYVDW